jgi:hypothetical protein
MVETKRPLTAKVRRPKRPTPKPRAASPLKDHARVVEDAVEIVPKKGRKGKGDGPEGEYWDVVVHGTRAGEVFVNLIDEPPIGKHASLQIFLNKPQQGRGIGRVAYRMAADASHHNPIYLHMRKSNIASRRAAEAAGFEDVTPSDVTQLILKRQKHAV